MKDRILETWNYLHGIPELANKEEQTSSFLAQRLKEAGFTVTEHIGGTGVVGVLKGAEEGPVCAFRADMDALPHVVDGKDVVMHSCGHDANCSMVLTMAEEIAKTGIKRGALKIVFQAAEEVLQGALAMIDAGMISDVDYFFGIHLRPVQEIGLGKAIAALSHGGTLFTELEVIGKSTHGARPHLGVNSIDAAVQIVNAVNAVKENPAVNWSSKVTRFNSNSPAMNTIPEKVAMSIDTRASDNDALESLKSKLEAIITHIPMAFGAEGKIINTGRVPAADLDAGATGIAAEAIVNVLGEEGLVPFLQTSGSDDFHFYKASKNSIKTGFIGVGADLTPGLHMPSMTFNKEALKIGADILIYTANKLLN